MSNDTIDLNSLDNADLAEAYIEGNDEAYSVIEERLESESAYDFCFKHYESDDSDRVLALLEHLDDASSIHPSDVTELSYDHYGLTLLDVGGNEYAVGTDDQCDSAVTEHIRQSLWAFTPSFLSSQTDLPEEVFAALSEQCEGANDAIERIVEKCVEGGVEAFAEQAAACDGRGHFLGSYDGEENEVCFDVRKKDSYEYFNVYRVN